MINLDHISSNPILPEAKEAMIDAINKDYGNPSSQHTKGEAAAEVLEKSRESVMKLINCENPKEIVFTSGGTESINHAIKGAAFANMKKGKHIIISKIEHHAVLNTCHYLEKQGFEITYLPVDKDGIVILDELKKAIKPETVLISIMHANNEIGTVQPIEEIGKIARKHKVVFHTDAVQSVGKIKTEWDSTSPKSEILSALNHCANNSGCSSNILTIFFVQTLCAPRNAV